MEKIKKSCLNCKNVRWEKPYNSKEKASFCYSSKKTNGKYTGYCIYVFDNGDICSEFEEN